MAATESGVLDPRNRLLNAAIAHVTEHGVADVSLRRLATALGTSHRMLIYHFGSKEGLLVEIVRAVEDEQRRRFAELAAEPGLSPGEFARRFWRGLTDPATAPRERLFFELYGQALQGRPGTEPLLDGVVDTWLGPMTAWASGQGLAPETARAQARLGLAVVRGLLLDLLATGDHAGVDAALDRFVTTTEALLTHSSSD